jgi:hypothetical protein|tara:strand:- start:1658 stop:2278 length:621 start_codon:yes stop_codon:yes gene_type:complete
MIIKPNMKKMFKKANIASGNTVNIGLAPSGGGMSGFARLKNSDKSKKRGSKRFMDNIKKGQEFSASMKAGKEGAEEVKANMTSNFTKIPNYKEAFSQAIGAGMATPIVPKKKPSSDPILRSGFNIAAIEAREAGEDSFTYGGKKFPVTKRMKEDGDGMYRMETMTPMNPMGAVPLRRNEMPMAYKQKVVKRTAGAKAIPFTNKNAL